MIEPLLYFYIKKNITEYIIELKFILFIFIIFITIRETITFLLQ
jgi:hypothetical protein